MSISETKAIYDFTQMTRAGTLVWKRKPIFSEGFANSAILELYDTSLNGEAMELSVEGRVDSDGEVDYHREVTHLWILDEHHKHLWRFSDNEALGDLLSTVRFQTGKVQDRLKRLLGGNERRVGGK